MNERLSTSLVAITALAAIVLVGVVSVAVCLFLMFRWIAGQPLAFANPVVMASYSVALVVGGLLLGQFSGLSHGLVDALGDMAAAFGATMGLGGRKRRADERRVAAETGKLEAEADSLRPPPFLVGTNGSDQSHGVEWR